MATKKAPPRKYRLNLSMFVYPWHKWFSRPSKKFVLKEGRDFTVSMMSMNYQIRTAAAKRGLKCSISNTRDTITVTFSPNIKVQRVGKLKVDSPQSK